MSLASELRKVIEFDERYNVEGWHVALEGPCLTNLELAWRTSAVYEHARLQPVLLAMVEAIEGLEFILHQGNLATQGKWDATNDMKQTAYGTLARLREIVGMK